MPVPDYSHEYLMQQFKSLGYRLTLSGMCAGLAQMAIQAFLLGEIEFERFNKRLELIASTPDLAQKVAEAKALMADRSRRKRAGEIVTPLSTEKQAEIEALLDVAICFEALILYHEPEQYKEVFGKVISQMKIAEIIPFALPKMMEEKKESIEVVESFCGIYSLTELHDYLIKFDELVRSSAPSTDLIMSLTGTNHRIAVGHDKNKGPIYTLMDANRLPPKIQQIEIKKLASALFDVLGSNIGEGASPPFIAFNTTILSTSRNKTATKTLFHTLESTDEFKEAHDVTLERAARKTGALNVSLGYIAAMHNDKPLLKKLAALPSTVDWVNTCNSVGVSPAYVTAAVGYSEAIPLLVDAKADLTKADVNNGQTPLLAAVIKSETATVTALATIQPELLLAEAKSRTAISLAAGSGHIDTLNFLLSKIPTVIPRDHLTKPDSSGWEPIHYAAANGFVDVIEKLADEKVDLTKALPDGQTIFSLAASKGHVALVRYLAGKMDINNPDSRNWSPLHYAATHGHLDVLKELKSKGADLTKEMPGGWTAVYLAAAYGRLASLKWMLDQTPTAINKKSDVEGITPLMGAAKEGQVEVITELISRGADLTLEDKAGYTAIHHAALQNKLDVLKVFDDNGANVEIASTTPGTNLGKKPIDLTTSPDIQRFLNAVALRNKLVAEIDRIVTVNPKNAAAIKALKAKIKEVSRNKSAEFLSQYDSPVTVQAALALFAVKENMSAALDALSSAGVNFHIQDQDGLYPIHHASKENLIDCFKALAELKEVKLDEKDINGQSPLYYALTQETDPKEIIEVLRDKNADLITKPFADGSRPIDLAVRNNHPEAVRVLADDKKNDVNKPDSAGWYLIHRAARDGFHKVVDVLIEKKADKNQLSTGDWSALHYAAKEGKFAVVKELVSKKADLTSMLPDGSTVIYTAARGGDVECLKYLLDHVPSDYLDKAPDDKDTPLIIAAGEGHVGIVAELMKRGAELKLEDENGFTAIHAAAHYGKVDVLKWFDANGHNLEMISTTPGDNRGKKPYQVGSSIHVNTFLLAVSARKSLFALIDSLAYTRNSENDKAIAKLKSRMVDLTQNDYAKFYNEYGLLPPETAIAFFAVKENMPEVLGLLIKAGIKFDALDLHGFDPIYYAAKNNDAACVKALASEVKLDKTYSDGNALIHHAVLSGSQDVIKVLDEKTISIDQPNAKGETALHLAALSGDTNIVRALIAKKADVTIPWNDGSTVVGLAAKKGHMRPLTYLLDAMPSELDKPNARTGMTPLMAAAAEGQVAIVEKLIQRGAELKIEDNDGLTAVHHAAIKDQLNVFKLLDLLNTDFDVPSVKVGTHHGKKPIDLTGSSPNVRNFLQAVTLRRSLIRTLDGLAYTVSRQNTQAITKLKMRLLEVSREKSAEFFSNYGAPLSLQAALALFAIRENIPEVFSALSEAGIDLMVQRQDGLTSLDLADALPDKSLSKKLLDTIAIDAAKKNRIDILIELDNANRNLEFKSAQTGPDLGLTPMDVAGSEAKIYLQARAVRHALYKLIDQTKMSDTIKSEFKRQIHIDSQRHYKELVANYTLSANVALTFIAVNHDNEDVVPVLAKEGVIVDLPNHLGLFPPHVAAMKGHHSVLSALTAYSMVDMTRESTSGLTAAAFAVDHNQISFITKLRIFHPASLAKVESDGTTLLMRAARAGHPTLALSLLESDKELSEENKAGFTAVHEAAKANSVGVLSAFDLAMRDRSSVDYFDLKSITSGPMQGKTPLDVAGGEEAKKFLRAVKFRQTLFQSTLITEGLRASLMVEFSNDYEAFILKYEKFTPHNALLAAAIQYDDRVSLFRLISQGAPPGLADFHLFDKNLKLFDICKTKMKYYYYIFFDNTRITNLLSIGLRTTITPDEHISLTHLRKINELVSRLLDILNNYRPGKNKQRQIAVKNIISSINDVYSAFGNATTHAEEEYAFKLFKSEIEKIRSEVEKDHKKNTYLSARVFSTTLFSSSSTLDTKLKKALSEDEKTASAAPSAVDAKTKPTSD